MDTDQGQQWKCHAGQLKSWLPSLPASSPEANVEKELPQLAGEFSQDLPEEPPNDSDKLEPSEKSSAPS